MAGMELFFKAPAKHGDLHKLQKDVYYCVQAVGDITTYSGHAGSTSDRWDGVVLQSAGKVGSRGRRRNRGHGDFAESI
jgi:hypothetical protein